MSILKVENLSTGYGKKQVLFNVSFEVNKGDVVLVAGSNGSGKSTLLKAIYGLLPQWGDGRLVFDGEDITGKPTAALLKKGLLYIPQNNNLFEDLTVIENLEMAGLILNKKKFRDGLERVLSLFSILVSRLNRTPMTLSGGERQLLTLAMALLHQPKMILYDEPFAGLSPHNIDVIANSLKDLNEFFCTTLLLIEHRVKECIVFADKLIGLKYGMVYNSIKLNENYDIQEFYSVFV